MSDPYLEAQRRIDNKVDKAFSKIEKAGLLEELSILIAHLGSTQHKLNLKEISCH